MKTLSVRQSQAMDRRNEKRLGSVLVLSAAMMVIIFAFASFTIDIGYITLTKTQLQAAADSAALAGAQDLPEGWGTGASLSASQVTSLARQSAVDFAAANRSADRDSVYVHAQRDIRFGRRDWNYETGSWSETWGSAPYNLAEVTIRRNIVADEDSASSSGGSGDGPLNLFFGPLIGHSTAGLPVMAVAALQPGDGFRIDPGSNERAEVLPIALDEETWNQMLAGVGDGNYSWDESTGTVTSGSDGIIDFDLYPISDSSLPAGNRGTVDFGASNNSTSEIERQIIYGLNDADLAYFGGKLSVADGPLLLNGDTGLSVGIKDELTAVIGLPRAIPIFRNVTNPGNNATFTIVKFVGVRILDVKLTGEHKYVMIQPATFVNSTVHVGDSSSIIREDSILAPSGLIR